MNGRKVSQTRREEDSPGEKQPKQCVMGGNVYRDDCQKFAMVGFAVIKRCRVQYHVNSLAEQNASHIASDLAPLAPSQARATCLKACVPAHIELLWEASRETHAHPTSAAHVCSQEHTSFHYRNPLKALVIRARRTATSMSTPSRINAMPQYANRNSQGGLRYPSSKKTIYDRNLNRSKNSEISRSVFAYLFIEMINYAQRQVSGI